jgi:hypothetical protein
MLASDMLNLTFFPKGAILMYDGHLWDRSGGIPGWHICNGQNGTINLMDKFIRGGTTARQTDGADERKLTSANMPEHGHTFTGTTANGSIDAASQSNHQSAFEGVSSASGVFASSRFAMRGCFGDTSGSLSSISSLKFSMTPAGNISNSGHSNPAAFDNRPAFCTVIFIEKIV